MNWDTIQNFSSNLVFGILLFAMTIYWVSLSFFKEKNNVVYIGRTSAIIANLLLFFILGSRWIVAGYFPLSNLYESLLFLTWTLLTIYLYVESKTKSKLMGAVLIPVGRPTVPVCNAVVVVVLLFEVQFRIVRRSTFML